MAKKVLRTMKIVAMGGEASPAKLGQKLGPYGIGGKFCQEFNAKSSDRRGELVPAMLTIYEDKSFEIVLKTSPVTFLTPASNFINFSSTQILGTEGSQLFLYRIIGNSIKWRKIHAWIGALVCSKLAKFHPKCSLNSGKPHDCSFGDQNANTRRIYPYVWNWFVFSMPALRLYPSFVQCL